MKNLSRITTKKLGITFEEFCRRHLGSEYKTFLMRLRKRKFFPAEVVYMCWLLEVSCEELFECKYTELVMFQGKYGVTDKVREMWDKANDKERATLLSLLGLSSEGPISKAPDMLASLFIDTGEPRKSEQPQQERAPEPPKAKDDFPFIETYG